MVDFVTYVATLQGVGQEGKRDISCVTQRSKFFGSAGV
jgi:hypothetical protein